MKKIPVVAVVGPTASGKTALSVELAIKFFGEIVSADSMQVYKGMDISSAKPTNDEKKGIAHHLMDFLELEQKYSVADYVKAGHSVINEIISRGSLPIITGGTGLYIDSLLGNIDFGETGQTPTKRAEFASRYADKSGEELLAVLAEFDRESADRLHPNNRGRILRAIEVYELTGITQTEQNRKSRQRESPYRVLYIGLDSRDRQLLYDRIDSRVDLMLQNGLLEEARELAALPESTTAAQAIGCKELKAAVLGLDSLENCVNRLKQSTRRYAKRQLTWFRRNKEINWLYIDEIDKEELLERASVLVQSFLAEGGEIK